jgi:Leucine-rich repeat (LRR) protein
VKEYFIEGFKISEHEDYKTLFLKSEDMDKAFMVFRENDINDLFISEYTGFKKKDLDFFAEHNWFDSVRIGEGEFDISGIYHLKKLKKLIYYRNNPVSINFKEFKEIEEISFVWGKGDESIFDCTSLIKLNVNKFKRTDLSDFAKLSHLQYLGISDSDLSSINGICSLPNIKCISLSSLKKINTLKGIGCLTILNRLEIDKCPNINDISDIANLPNLEFCFLDNLKKINSIKALSELKKLKSVTLSGNTDIEDGNLSPLIGKSFVVFADRKHYNYTLKEINKINGNVYPKQAWDI